MAIKFDYEDAIKRAKPGESFFIPTLRPQIHTPEIQSIARQLKREIQIKNVTEQYINGIRVWILK